MKKQHILIVSHGQTVSQVQNVFSHPETEMTTQGREEVLSTGDEILKSTIKYKKIYCSNLPRATETAGILSNKLHIPFIILPELAQQDFGIYTGQSNTKENYTNYINDLLAENGNCEPITRVLANLQKAVKKIADTQEDAIVVAHRFTWLGFEVYFNGTPFAQDLLFAQERKTFTRDL